ncbi:MAG: hypothetical protein LBI15_04160 [Dysgonamonadaceae bacterium]|jgi:lipoprotein signal peptidase|nr:hypothetical protein [Dysgonamonadaceae bacterium]
MEWIINNKEWIFSGIGVAVISLIIALLARRKSKKTTFKQTNLFGSKGTQIKGNYYDK